MISRLQRLAALLMALALLCMTAPALAEDVYVVEDASAASAVHMDCSYLRVVCPLDGVQHVTMTISDAWGYPVFQRDYGLCDGRFRSEDVYLRLDGSETVYNVTVEAGSQTYRFRVTREVPYVTDPGVYAYGLPLAQITGGRSNKHVVVLDVDALEGSTLSVPLVSGGAVLGYANLTVDGGALSVAAMLTAQGTIDKATVYVAHDAVTAMTLGSNHFTGVKTKLNRDVDLNGTPYVAVMVQLTVSYDGETVQALYPDSYFLEEQEALWEMMQLTTAAEAVG